jgi:hypothetical protein
MPVTFRGNPHYQCEGKHNYRRKSDAKAAARQTMSASSHHTEKRGRLIAYRCPWCAFWHVGHPPTERPG